MAVACVVRAIHGMGLEVAPHKSEALFLRRGKRNHMHGAPPDAAYVVVDGTSVRVGTQLKYLGLYLDNTWSFNGHFQRLAPRVEAVVHSLSRLLPNLGGPDGKVRRLYAMTVRAVALYGSPVWAGALMASRRGKMLLRRIFRRVVIRVIRGYRTVSHTAASVLAGLPPIELYALMHTEVYRRTKELGGLGVVLIPRVRAAVRLQARRRMLERWLEDLSNPRDNSRARVVEAVRPRLIKWAERAGGEMSYRMAQVFLRAMDVLALTCAVSVAKWTRAATTAGRTRTRRNTL
ncbi:uncharacterized protein LOC115243073 [Formica exsecta]|uniref:uncharacterized protein LOC115243073 n=1 Tax=Formica exsecta TaxID=72781 RepID=UPI001144B803|nr:uncharacterized protein LOC115243073 [Formica exsecta]